SLAYAMYTSGTSGTPKGVLIEHRSILRLVRDTNFLTLGPEDRVLMTGSVAFDASTFEIWGPLLNGGAVSRPAGVEVLDPAVIGALVRQQSITTMWITSSLFNQFVDADPRLFMGLNHLLTGGERLSPHHVNRVRRALPELVLINGYGPTE